MTAFLNAELERAAPGSTVYIPARRYVISAPLVMHSSTAIKCGAGAVFVASPVWANPAGRDPARIAGFAGIINEHFDSSSITDSNLTIEGCGFDYSALLGRGSGQHAIRIRKAAHVRIRDVHCTNVGDCTAMLATEDSVIENSTASGISNACWDHWEAPVDIVVRGNWCRTRLYGVLVTGTNTAGSAGGVPTGMARRGQIEENTVVMDGWAGAGIWLNGLQAVGAGTSGIQVRNNSILLEASPDGTCIKLSGAGAGNIIARNICKAGRGRAQAGIMVGSSGDMGGTPTDNLVTDNVLDGLTVSAGGVGVINEAGTGDRIMRNQVFHGLYPFALYVHGRNQVVSDNTVVPGTAGILDQTGQSGLRAERETR